MSKYVIIRSDGAYVARIGGSNSYTKYLQNAQIWKDKRSAEKERCGNESVINIDNI